MRKGRGSWRFASMHDKTDGNAMSVSQARACRVSANKTTATHKPAIWTGNLLVSEPQHGLWCETCERTTRSYEITCCMCENTDHNLTSKKNCIDPQTNIIPHSCHPPTNKSRWKCCEPVDHEQDEIDWQLLAVTPSNRHHTHSVDRPTCPQQHFTNQTMEKAFSSFISFYHFARR